MCGCITIKCIIQNEDAKDKVLLLCNIGFLYQLWRLHFWKKIKIGIYVLGKTLWEAGD
jgi:hypothetical protein